MAIIEDPSGSGEYTFEPGYTIDPAKWATVADVADVAGVTVTADELRQARNIIETLVGLFEATYRPDISDRDREWLRRAVCYEAAFVHDNPDLFSRIDVTSASQDGEAVAFRNADAHLLAPLARKCIRRLSWRGLHRAADVAADRRQVSILDEDYDDSLAWERV